MPTSINLAISVPGIPSCKPRYGLSPPRLGGSHTPSAYGYYASLFVEGDGGVIQVEAKDTADTASRDEIRMHLGHIARAFQNGEFEIPIFVHETVPSGAPGMKRLQKEIKYTFEESASGRSVVISSAERDAIAAIHNFLRFQIEEHKTGDTTEVR